MEKEWFEPLLKEYNNGTTINRVVNIEQAPAIGKGENYTSVLLRCWIAVEFNNGKKITISVILKTLPELKIDAAFCSETTIFRNEIFMYSVVMREMEKIMEEFNEKQGKLWPSLLGYRNNDKLILEDLTESNYAVANRLQMLDFEYSKFTLESVARFHAMSAVILKRNILNPTHFNKLLFVSNKRMIDMFFVSFFTTFAESVKEHWGPEWSDFVKHLYKAADEALEKYTKMINYKECKFKVINHGDCWTNNMMFKCDPVTKKPVGIRFIDYQMSHCNSFAWDITYFIYNATHPNVRRTRYLDLLAAYHQSLRECLLSYSFSNDEIPTMNDVVEEMERLKFFGFGVLTSIHAFTSAKTENPYDLLRAYATEHAPADAINKDIFTCKLYRSKIEQDMKNFMLEGVI